MYYIRIATENEVILKIRIRIRVKNISYSNMSIIYINILSLWLCSLFIILYDRKIAVVLSKAKSV